MEYSTWPLAAIVSLLVINIAVFGRFVIKPRFHGRAAERLVNLTLALGAVTLVAIFVVFALIF